MSGPLFSSAWFRVKQLKPRLRSHARIHRHRYRGEIWYVLQDPSKQRFHRFTPAAQRVIGMLDGKRSLDEAWNLAFAEMGDDAPTQDEMIELLAALHAADVLQADVPPDAIEIFERGRKQRSQRLRSRLLSPFSIQIPLVDPERFLSATLPLVRPLLGPLGLVLWLAVLLPALVGVGMHWSELTENILDRLFTPQSLLIVWLLFPVLKILHELGHGFAAKAFGGEVHDMGVMLLVFTPVPYVDASSSWAFRSKVQRALVGAAGMGVELFLAALAFYVWLAAEPGLLRAGAYNVLVISGASTLLFNANPLLKFDGYYVLSDLLEIPNLRSRANDYLRHHVEHHFFGRRDVAPPRTAPGEPAWFVTYATAAFLYRLVVVVAITLWILDQFFLAGILLGGFAFFGWVLMPLFKGARHVLTSPTLGRVRNRAIAVSTGGVALALLVVLALPFPLRTRAEGVVWIPEKSIVRAPVEGFVERVVAEPGSQVERGALLVELRDPKLVARAASLRARVKALEARHAALYVNERSQAQIIAETLEVERGSLVRALERLDSLRIHSEVDGRFVLPRADALPGTFVRQGQLLAHVVDFEHLRVRAVLSQEILDLVRARETRARVRSADAVETVYPAELTRIVPGASARLPSAALGSLGGGEVPVDPREGEGRSAFQSMFEVELDVPEHPTPATVGGRVYVRFDHGYEALASQWYRRLRQIFLSRLHV